MSLDLDNVIRTTIRDYRLSHGKDPKAFKVSKKVYIDLREEYGPHKRYHTPWEPSPGGPTLYGIPIVVTDKWTTADFDKNGCFTEDIGI